MACYLKPSSCTRYAHEKVVVCNSLEHILLFRFASIKLIEDLTQMAQQVWENNCTAYYMC